MQIRGKSSKPFHAIAPFLEKVRKPKVLSHFQRVQKWDIDVK